MNIWKKLDQHEWSAAQHERVKERLISHMCATRVEGTSRAKRFTWLHLSPVTAMVVLVALLGVSGGTVVAAQNDAPYERLYPVRMFTETMRTKMTRDPVKKTERAIAYSQERLVELRELAQAQAASEGRGRYPIALAAHKRFKGFQKNTQAIEVFSDIAQKQIERMREKNSMGTDVLAAELDAVLDTSLGILISVEVNAPANEPVRAVVTKTKQKISPIESEVEQARNAYKSRILDQLLIIRVVVPNAPATSTPEPVVEKPEVEVSEGEDVASPEEDVAQARKKSERKLEYTREAVKKAGAVVHQYEDKYGSEAMSGWRKIYERVSKRLKEAEDLIEGHAYHAGFEAADEVMRVASHITVSVRVMDHRSQVLIDDNDQVRLHILPEYEEDLGSSEGLKDEAALDSDDISNDEAEVESISNYSN